jgi:hypothetical protein
VVLVRTVIYVPAYAVLSSTDVPREAVESLLSPYDPRPSINPLGEIEPGWWAVRINDSLSLDINIESPYALPRTIRSPAAEIVGGPIVFYLGMMWTASPTPLISMDQYEASERAFKPLVAAAEALVWRIATDFGRRWPAAFNDMTANVAPLSGPGASSAYPWSQAGPQRSQAPRTSQRFSWRRLLGG